MLEKEVKQKMSYIKWYTFNTGILMNDQLNMNVLYM